MCELFAMSAREPASVTLSMSEFVRHGGVAGPHKDGWGIAFYNSRDVNLVRDTLAAGMSPWAVFLRDLAISSPLVVSHVRTATDGALALSNTQPFQRELGGRIHVFAHNGHIPSVRDTAAFGHGLCRPIGTTDSEHAFCALLRRLEPLWLASKPPAVGSRVEVVRTFAREIARHGPANFIYADSELLFAHGHRRTQSDGAIRSPGLHLLARDCPSTDPSFATKGLTVIAGRQRVHLIASVPLTGEPWRALGEGELVVIKDGEQLAGLE